MMLKRANLIAPCPTVEKGNGLIDCFAFGPREPKHRERIVLVTTEAKALRTSSGENSFGGSLNWQRTMSRRKFCDVVVEMVDGGPGLKVIIENGPTAECPGEIKDVLDDSGKPLCAARFFLVEPRLGLVILACDCCVE